jgi:hypothetical protein
MADWVAIPDHDQEVTYAKVRRILADDGWLDAKYEDTVLTNEAEYAKLIPQYCGNNLPGKVVPCPQPATPDSIFNDCVARGFPDWNKQQFQDARDALYYRKGEEPPKTPDLPTFRSKKRGGVLPVEYPGWVFVTTYKIGDIVRSSDKHWKSIIEPNKGNLPINTPSAWTVYTPGGTPTPPPVPYTPAKPADINLKPVDYTRPKDAKKAKDFDEKYGSTYVEFLNNRKKFCEEQSNEENYETYQEWWDNIGSKFNSPCKLSGLKSGDPLPYNPGKINNDLDRPICRQWRAKADTLTKQMGPDAYYDEPNIDPNNPGNKIVIRRLKGLEYDKRIPPSAWKGYDASNPTQSHFVNDNSKWIWQHEITTPREVMGLNLPIPGGCPLPAGVIAPDDSFSAPMGPDACLAKQRELYNIAKTSAEADKCVNKGLACQFDETHLPMLLDSVVNIVKNAIPGLQNAGEFKDKAVKFIIQELFGADPTARKVTSTDPLKVDGWITAPGATDTRDGAKAIAGWAGKTGIEELFNFLGSLVPGDKPFGNAFGAPQNIQNIINKMAPEKPLPSYFDPLEGRRVPEQNTNERLNELLKRRVANDGPLYKGAVHPGDWDKVGYDVELTNQASSNQDLIRGGKGTVKEKAMYDTIVKRLMYVLHLANKAKNSQHGGARPHHKFEKILISYGISPDVYLNHARRKAKSAGLRASLLGFSHDEKHKLTIPNEEGRLVSFGSAGMGDHILYSLLKDPKANQHRTSYLARATKIRGDWKKSPYSPNSLAIKVLW